MKFFAEPMKAMFNLMYIVESTIGLKEVSLHAKHSRSFHSLIQKRWVKVWFYRIDSLVGMCLDYDIISKNMKKCIMKIMLEYKPTPENTVLCVEEFRLEVNLWNMSPRKTKNFV